MAKQNIFYSSILFLLTLSLTSFSEETIVKGKERAPRKPGTVIAPKTNSGSVTKPGSKSTTSSKKPGTNTPSRSQSDSAKNANFWTPKHLSPVFIVINVATEKLRVYRRCVKVQPCPHQMLFETEIIAGQETKASPDPKVYATRLGHFKISKWIKFYEDKNKNFPAWYKSGYPLVNRGASVKDWLGSKFLPEPQINKYRGSYGWLTALLGPNANEQWLHGTYGYGEDSQEFIAHLRNPLVSFFDDPLALGTIRTDNPSIAYIRHLAETGADVYRVYALEAYATKNQQPGSSLSSDAKTWNWVLTTRNAQKETGSLDRKAQALMYYSSSEILDEGAFKIDTTPTGLGFSYTLFGLGAGSGTTGNTYQIKRKQFRGVFLVDEGRFVDYEHPKADKIFTGGFENSVISDDLKANVEFNLAPAFSDQTGPQ